MQQVAEGRRPLGVTIMAVLLGLAGLGELLLGILAIVALVTLGSHVSNSGHHITGAAVDTIGGIIGSIPLIFGLVSLFFAWALWTLRRWAFWGVIIYAGIVVVHHIIEIIRPSPGHSLAGVIAGMIIPVIILLYFLIDSNVRRAFRV